MSRHLLRLAVLAVALISTPLLAAENGLPPIKGVPSVARGKALSERWCASCHLVKPGQSVASSEMPPPFLTLAKQFDTRKAEYRAFLQAPHSPMIGISLSRTNIDDILLYLKSLAPKAGK